MQADQKEKCQHEGCRCSVPQGQAYCSEHCRKAAQGALMGRARDTECDCGHDECRTARESLQRTAQ